MTTPLTISSHPPNKNLDLLAELSKPTEQASTKSQNSNTTLNPLVLSSSCTLKIVDSIDRLTFLAILVLVGSAMALVIENKYSEVPSIAIFHFIDTFIDLTLVYSFTVLLIIKGSSIGAILFYNLIVSVTSTPRFIARRR